MNLIRDIFLLCACALCGIAGGYYGGNLTDAPAQVAIVDVPALIRQSSATTTGQSQVEADHLAQKIKAATAGLVSQGIVVISSEAVVNAPEEAYVSID